MSSGNQAAISNLLSQSLQTVQQQLLTNSNILSATNAVVQTNTTAIVSNSVAITASSTDIQEINSDISTVNQAITNLATKQQNDVDDLQEQINDNLIQLETLEEKEDQDVNNINASIANLQLLINQNTSDIVAVKNTDITFTNEFITVSNELHELAEQHASDTTLLQGQITSTIADLNALETKEINDIESLTTQLNQANAVIATHTQNITALFSEDLTFSHEFTEISDSLTALIATEASDVADLNTRLDVHDERMNTISSSLQLTNESLDAQILKQAIDLASQNQNLGEFRTTLEALNAREQTNVINIESALDSQLSSINANTSAISANLAKQTLDYNTHQTHLTDIDSSISTLNGNVYNNTNDIGTLTNQLTTIVGGINTNVINLSSLESTISSTASSVSSMQSQITTIQQQANLPFETAHEWSQQQTFLVPPVMSGANIQSSTIPPSAIAGQFVDTNSVQYINGIKTFTMAPVFNMGLTANGSINFPNNSIPASCIAGLPSNGASLTSPNSWTEDQSFVNTSNSGNLTVSGNTTLGTDSFNTLTIRGNTSFNRPPTMSGEGILTNTIASNAIVGGVGASLSNANTWTNLQTFNYPPVMSGASITANTIPSSAISGGISVSLPTTTMTARTATQIGYQTTASFP